MMGSLDMVYTVFRDNQFEGLELLGEYSEQELETLTSEGFYCHKWEQFLKYRRSDLVIVLGHVVE
jgi:dihydroorotase